MQAHTDFLHHRCLRSAQAGHDIPNEEVLSRGVVAGRPGYPLAEPSRGPANPPMPP